MIRRYYIFHGRVQGVGFRITCYQIAMRLGLTGWVRNLSDGTVEVCAQGEELFVQRLLLELNNARFIKIERFDMKKLCVLQDEKSFEMKY